MIELATELQHAEDDELRRLALIQAHPDMVVGLTERVAEILKIGLTELAIAHASLPEEEQKIHVADELALFNPPVKIFALGDATQFQLPEFLPANDLREVEDLRRDEIRGRGERGEGLYATSSFAVAVRDGRRMRRCSAYVVAFYV